MMKWNSDFSYDIPTGIGSTTNNSIIYLEYYLAVLNFVTIYDISYYYARLYTVSCTAHKTRHEQNPEYINKKLLILFPSKSQYQKLRKTGDQSLLLLDDGAKTMLSIVLSGIPHHETRKRTGRK